MRLRDDIDIQNTWIVSDTHFGHDNIVGFCHRPEDHEQVMIAEWRKEVPDDATVLHLGDLCYRSNARFKNITAKELTGARKLLILGNHDRQRYNFYRQCGFQVVRPFAIPYNGRKLDFENGDDLRHYPDRIRHNDGWWSAGTFFVSFSHYPWNPSEDGLQSPRAWRLHGHIHNNGYTRNSFVPFLRQHINLSVEQTKFKPVNLGLLLDAAILGHYEETTEEQMQEAQDRKNENLARKEA